MAAGRGEKIDSFTFTDTSAFGDQRKFTYTYYSNGKVYQGRYFIKGPITRAEWLRFMDHTVKEAHSNDEGQV